MDTALENGCFTVTPDVVSSRLGDETVLLAVDSGVYFGLEGVGPRVWELLAAGVGSARAVWSALVEEYDVEPGRCWRDVLRLLDELRRRGLIRAAECTQNAPSVSTEQG